LILLPSNPTAASLGYDAETWKIADELELVVAPLLVSVGVEAGDSIPFAVTFDSKNPLSLKGKVHLAVMNEDEHPFPYDSSC